MENRHEWNQAKRQDGKRNALLEDFRQQHFSKVLQLFARLGQQGIQLCNQLVFILGEVGFGQLLRARKQANKFSVTLERFASRFFQRPENLLLLGEACFKFNDGFLRRRATCLVVAMHLHRLGLKLVFAAAFSIFNSSERLFLAVLVRSINPRAPRFVIRFR